MKDNKNLIVMLTYNDKTVENAHEIFKRCQNSKAELWGFKEIGIPLEQMKALYYHMKECGKTTVLEVVEYTEDKCLSAAMTAVECNCDILMGTVFYDSVNNLCKKNKIKYMPFVGYVKDRPSILSGSPEEMLAFAKSYLEKGVYGFDLLGYRYTGDASLLINRFVTSINAPVCVAGSINSFDRLNEIKAVAPWAFTIGSAFFKNKFGTDFCEQIDKVIDYTSKD